MIPDVEFRRAVLRKADADELEAVAARTQWKTIRQAAEEAAAEGRTTQAEVDRVLGPRG